jgi:hypothetical protein
MSDDDVTVVAVGDSAMWCTGTRYRDKTPNVVHKLLNDGDPIPPSQFRARGGATIGASEPYRVPFDEPTPDHVRKHDGEFDAEDDDYGYGPVASQHNDWVARSGRDVENVDNLAWTVRRDLGQAEPTVCQQLDQFPSREAGDAVPRLDVPRGGQQPVRFFGANGAFTRTPDAEPPYAEDVDLVLVNGGTNDIAESWLMDYTKHSYSDVLHAVERHCYDDQVYLLERTRERFPNAVIALVGYFPFVSDWTWYPTAKEFLRAFEGIKDAVGRNPGPGMIERIVDNAQVFARAHQHHMRRAVATRAGEEARTGKPGVFYVSRGFGNVHAFDGPEPWVWGLDGDDTYEVRKHATEEILGASDPAKLNAAIGHTNRTGSRKTAEVVVERYEAYREFSVRETVSMVSGADGPTVSVDDEFRSRGVFGDPRDAESLRLAHAQRLVDSIHLEFERRNSLKSEWQNSLMSRTPHLHGNSDLYLEIEPGRDSPDPSVASNANDREGYRVDWESDGESHDTPQFDKDSSLRTEVSIDPMMGRHMDSDDGDKQLGQVSVGRGSTAAGKKSQREDNVDNDDGYGTDVEWSETNHGGDDVLPNDPREYYGRHDTVRMELADVEKLTLRIDNPSYWALQHVNVSINGALTYWVDAVGSDDLQDHIGKAVDRGDDVVRIPLFDHT